MNKNVRKLFWASFSIGVFLLFKPHTQAQSTVIEVSTESAEKLASTLEPVPEKKPEIEVGESEAERKEREKPTPPPEPKPVKPRPRNSGVMKREVVTRSAPTRVESGNYNNCVAFVRSQGINTGPLPGGVARNWPVNSNTPQVGSVVVTAESPAGHVAIVRAVNGDSITLDEANYIPGKRSTRTISKNSSVIRGYYN